MKKIYCILGNLPFLESNKGDKINEINTYLALSKNFQVYYNNRLLDFNDLKYFGTNPNDKISLPDKHYDLYYVRNNPQIFLQLPHPKLYFCVPNHQNCFKEADGLVFPTNSWSVSMENLSLKLDTIYNKTDYIPKNKIIFNQITYPEDLSNHEKVKKIKKDFNNKFIIGHFGRVVNSNLPNLNIKSTKDDVVLYVGTSNKYNNIITIPNIPITEIKYYISACDLLLYNQDYQGEFAGSLKIMDALSYGIPIITPKYRSRIDELGEDYPLYFNKEDINIDYIKKILLENKELKNYMFKRSQYYNLENTAQRYKNQLEKII